MSQPINRNTIDSCAQAACHLAALAIFGLWNFGPLFLRRSDPPPALALLLLLGAGSSLVCFLTYRAHAHLHAAGIAPAMALARRVDVYLYETGDELLLGLCVAWLLLFGRWGREQQLTSIGGRALTLATGVVLPSLLVMVAVTGLRARARGQCGKRTVNWSTVFRLSMMRKLTTTKRSKRRTSWMSIS